MFTSDRDTGTGAGIKIFENRIRIRILNKEKTRSKSGAGALFYKNGRIAGIPEQKPKTGTPLLGNVSNQRTICQMMYDQ